MSSTPLPSTQDFDARLLGPSLAGLLRTDMEQQIEAQYARLREAYHARGSELKIVRDQLAQAEILHNKVGEAASTVTEAVQQFRQVIDQELDDKIAKAIDSFSRRLRDEAGGVVDNWKAKFDNAIGTVVQPVMDNALRRTAEVYGLEQQLARLEVKNLELNDHVFELQSTNEREQEKISEERDAMIALTERLEQEREDAINAAHWAEQKTDEAKNELIASELALERCEEDKQRMAHECELDKQEMDSRATQLATRLRAERNEARQELDTARKQLNTLTATKQSLNTCEFERKRLQLDLMAAQADWQGAMRHQQVTAQALTLAQQTQQEQATRLEELKAELKRADADSKARIEALQNDLVLRNEQHAKVIQHSNLIADELRQLREEFDNNT